MRAFSRDRFSNLKRPHRRGRPRAILFTASALIAVIAPGCGGNSGSDQQNQAADAQAAAAAGQPNAAPAANAGQANKAGGRKALKFAFKAGADQKDASKQEDAAKKLEVSSSKDVSKWEFADLKAALNRKDVRFCMGVLIFGMSKPRDSNRGTDLNALLREVAKLKDDPKIDLPLPAMAAMPGQPAVVNPAGFQMRPPGAAAGGFQLGAGKRRKKDKG